MRKPVFLAILGVSIVVSAVSLGITLTRYIGLRAYSPKGEAMAAAAPAASNLPATPPEQWNNLFAPGDGMKIASRLPAANATSGSQAPQSIFLLVGTVDSSSPSVRRAILWTNGMKEPKAFREKEEVEPGAILSSVERDKVWITRGKEREKLELLPVGSRSRPTPTSPSTAALPATAPPSASIALPPASSPGTPPRPETVASPPPAPARTRAVAPRASSEDEEEEPLSARERRRRSRGYRR